MPNVQRGFCMVIIFFCSSSHSEGWMGKVLNCIKGKRTEWALWRWHKSRGESAINVNAFCVTSTILIRPCLLLSRESVNSFPRSLVAQYISAAYDNTKRILLSMRCELECSSSWSRPSSAPLLSLSFLKPCLDHLRNRPCAGGVKGYFRWRTRREPSYCISVGKNCSLQLFFLPPSCHAYSF